MRAARLAVAEPSGLGRVVVGRAGQGIGRDIQQIVGEGVDRRRKRRWRRRVQPVQQILCADDLRQAGVDRYRRGGDGSAAPVAWVCSDTPVRTVV